MKEYIVKYIQQVQERSYYCQHDNEPSGSTRGEELLDPLCDYRLLKKGSDTSCSLHESVNQCNTQS
jgi:hypothetical protein